MIIGHLPAGYIVSKLLFPRLESAGVTLKLFLLAGITGAVAPDFDMAYFHLADHRQHHHHTYFTHFPVIWVILLLLSLSCFYLGKTKGRVALAVIFSLNGLVHMLLDTIVGDIWWFAPFVDKPFSFFTVPALYKPWWLNFLFHWSFAMELAVAGWAIYLWRRSPGHPINIKEPKTE